MKIAVITGGNRGIGRSTAINVAKRGVGVILTYNSHAEEAERVVSEIEKNGGKAVRSNWTSPRLPLLGILRAC